MRIVSAGKSDVGMVRTNNEDFFSIGNDLNLFMVADGMGGHASGEVASQMAIEIISDNYRRAMKEKKTPHLGKYDKTLSPEANLLLSSIRFANRAIYELSMEKKDYNGMGTTLVALLVLERTLVLAHVGDSRIYRIRDGLIEQVTEDHSLVAQQLKLGLITEEEARSSKAKNVVTRALGVAKTVDVDIDEQVIMNDDYYLLCSDGLSDMVSDEEILRTVMANGDDPHDACNQLIKLANEMGGYDNITVVLVHLVDFKPRGRFLGKLFGRNEG